MNCLIKFVIRLTLIWVGFLEVRFEVGDSAGGGGGKNPLFLIPPPSASLKPVRIMLETWRLLRKHKPIWSFRKYIIYYQGSLNFLMSTFFCKNQHFLAEIVPLLKAIVWELCWRFFSSVFLSWKMKGYC